MKVKRSHSLLLMKILVFMGCFLLYLFTDSIFITVWENHPVEIQGNSSLAVLNGENVATILNLEEQSNVFHQQELFIPFKVILTKNQKPGTCPEVYLPCETDNDCLQQPSGISSKKNKCGEVVGFQEEKIKGCFVESWCPKENIYTTDTLIYFTNYPKVVIQIKNFEGESINNSVFNSEDLFLETKNLLFGSGFHSNEIENVGGVLHVSFGQHCVKFWWFETCKETVDLMPFLNEDYSIGFGKQFQEEKLNASQVRDKVHQVGLQIFVSSLKILNKVDFPQLCLWIVFLYMGYHFIYDNLVQRYFIDGK